MKALDRIFGCLMLAGGLGHGLRSYKAYSSEPVTLLWALSASFVAFLLAAINLLRAGRRGDRALAWICFAGCLGSSAFALWFGLLIGNVFDFRPMGNLIIALALAIFSLHSAMQPRHP
jgi:predicted Na+-dependent transporter